jgi:hypothetical protein
MLHKFALAFLAIPLTLTACGEAGSKAADVVQAATKGAVEIGQELANAAAELAQLAPEEARAKLQGVLDAAADKLKEVRDSQTAQRIAAELERGLQELIELAKKLGQALNLEQLETALAELVQRFKSDPRVTNALESLKQRLEALTH